MPKETQLFVIPLTFNFMAWVNEFNPLSNNARWTYLGLYYIGETSVFSLDRSRTMPVTDRQTDRNPEVSQFRATHSFLYVDALYKLCHLREKRVCIECTMADTAAYAPGRRCERTHQMAALFCLKCRHGRHHKVGLHVNRFVFTCRTLLPNFTTIRFKTTYEAFAFFEEVAQTGRRTRWVAIWDQFLIQLAMKPLKQVDKELFHAQHFAVSAHN